MEVTWVGWKNQGQRAEKHVKLRFHQRRKYAISREKLGLTGSHLWVVVTPLVRGNVYTR